MIVTIDGPAGSGKSTAARGVAALLGFDFLDTGAMYRAVALRCLQAGINLRDEQAAADVARSTEIVALGNRVLADGVDVTQAIRTAEVAQAASIVAINPEVRAALVKLQRKAAAGRNIVTEGRDQGTVVFPDAECKFYVTAAAEERARRRMLETSGQPGAPSYDETLNQIRERDSRDRSRDVAPLKQADDAVRVDTTGKSAEEVLALLAGLIRERASRDSCDPTRRSSSETSP